MLTRCAVFAIVLAAHAQRAGAAPMVVAPHIAGEAFCPAAANDATILNDDQAWARCAAAGQTSAARLGAFLDSLGPTLSPSGHFALGYTLTLPVLGLYVHRGASWAIDPRRVDSMVGLIAAVDRPVVLYLSANHFTDSGIELSRTLAADSHNLMWTRHGPLSLGNYFVVGLYAWTLADEQAQMTKLREDGFAAVLSAVCRLPVAARARIVGVNVLGETHQLFAGFPDKMGYPGALDITDDSPASVAGFRRYLANRFRTIQSFDSATGSDAKRFDAIEPPAHDLHHETLHGFAQQWDDAAAGTLVLQGWAYDDAGTPLAAQLWVDGKKAVEGPVWFNRLDVSDAIPGLRSPNVGWKLAWDYRAVPFGIHVLDVLIAAPGHEAVRIAQRHVVVDDRTRDTPSRNDYAGVPAALVASWKGLHAYLDSPNDWASLFYNPLARLWQDWREAQVRAYITHFARIVGRSCLGKDMVFSHQINARLNSSWDTELLAVGASEEPSADYRPGTTLYGGAAFGDAFFDMAKTLGWNDYAVTEMDPLFGLSRAQMEAMLERHRLAHARYVEPYYMSIKPARLESDLSEVAKRRLRAGNPVGGAGTFYDAIHAMMTER